MAIHRLQRLHSLLPSLAEALMVGPTIPSELAAELMLRLADVAEMVNERAKALPTSAKLEALERAPLPHEYIAEPDAYRSPIMFMLGLSGEIPAGETFIISRPWELLEERAALPYRLVINKSEQPGLIVEELRWGKSWQMKLGEASENFAANQQRKPLSAELGPREALRPGELVSLVVRNTTEAAVMFVGALLLQEVALGTEPVADEGALRRAAPRALVLRGAIVNFNSGVDTRGAVLDARDIDTNEPVADEGALRRAVAIDSLSVTDGFAGDDDDLRQAVLIDAERSRAAGLRTPLIEAQDAEQLAYVDWTRTGAHPEHEQLEAARARLDSEERAAVEAIKQRPPASGGVDADKTP